MKTKVCQDFINLLEIFNTYFNKNFPERVSDKTLYIQDVKLVRKGLKQLYLSDIEIWINESIHFNTEYVVFHYITKKSEKIKINEILNKDPSKELSPILLSIYKKLCSLDIIKINNF
jgi:hypothetical protein